MGPSCSDDSRINQGDILMSTLEQKRKGLARVLWKRLEGLNNKEKFKEFYAGRILKILINFKDQKFAALITIENGQLDIKSIKNDEDLLKTLVLDSFIECTSNIYAKLSGNNKSKVSLLWNLVTGRLKIHGKKTLREFKEILKTLNYGI